MTRIQLTTEAPSIRNGWLAAPTPELTAILDMLAAALPGYGSVTFTLDEDLTLQRDSSVL
jgi:hypothetical protein